MPPKDKSKNKSKRDSTPDKNVNLDELKTDLESAGKKQVIFDETIAKLLITEEDLAALDTNEPEEDTVTSAEASANQVKVAIRKEIPLENRKPLTTKVKILRKAPPNAPVKLPASDVLTGPRMTNDGRVVPHSILGSLSEYYRMALEKGLVEDWEIPLDIREEILSSRSTNQEVTSSHRLAAAALPLSARSEDREKIHSSCANLMQDADYAALRNWEKKMADRKRIQGHISNLLQRPVDQLVMNSGENYRAMQEERYIIDRTLAFRNDGKGYRIGSEFWKQNEILRKMENEEDQLHLTLTRTEQGYPPSIEHVGVPRSVKTEKGIDWPVSRTPRYPWKFPYYQMRRTQLEDIILELDPHTPDIDSLEVVASNALLRATSARTPANSVRNETSSKAENFVNFLNVSDEEEKENFHLTMKHVGPALSIGGHLVEWNGSTNQLINHVGLEARVLFQSFTGEKALEYLNIENKGTTVVRYYWKRMAKKNPFELVQPHSQRFYFDVQEGMLLPGEVLHFPVIFKSDFAGIYTEQWHIETVPVLCGGAKLLVTFRGIAQQEDFHANTRKRIERDLLEQVAERTVLNILEDLLNGIDVSERPRTPLDAYITDSEMFNRKNAEVTFVE